MKKKSPPNPTTPPATITAAIRPAPRRCLFRTTLLRGGGALLGALLFFCPLSVRNVLVLNRFLLHLTTSAPSGVHLSLQGDKESSLSSIRDGLRTSAGVGQTFDSYRCQMQSRSHQEQTPS